MIKISTGKGTDKNYISFFKVNNRLEIFLPNPENANTLDVYSSRIENVTPEGMAIATPISKGYALSLNAKETFVGRMMMSEAAYEFSCVYLDRVMEPLPVWLVSRPYNISKTQQRQFVRYDISLPVSVEIIDQKEKKDIGKLFHMNSKDISGGGFKLISKVPLISGASVAMTFQLPSYPSMTIGAKVIRTDRPQKGGALFWIACQFTDISPKERDMIVQFIFKKQLEDRRKFSGAKR